MGMDHANISNSNNRKLQKSIGRFSKIKFGDKIETRKIREFPTFHPKEAAAFREKIQKKVRQRKLLNIIISVFVTILILSILFLFNS